MLELDKVDASVGAVLASEVDDSKELRVEAMLCFDGVRVTPMQGLDPGVGIPGL